MSDVMLAEPEWFGTAHRPWSYYRLRFHGRGGEYFKIWIVNLLLSIITLGIYSAWAKVRTMRYLHGATELDSSRFGYHASPIAILIGRIVAILLFLPYVVVNQVSSVWSLAVLLAGLLVLPWLIWRAARFRLRVTSYRNIRFSFDPSGDALRQAYYRFLALPFLMLPTFGLITPYVRHQQLRWLAERARYGTTSFSAERGVGAFYLAYLQLLAALVGLVIVLAGLGILLMPPGGHFITRPTGQLPIPVLSPGSGAFIAILVVAYLGFIATLQGFRAWTRKLMLDRLSLAGMTMRAHYRRHQLVWLYFTNTLLMIVTLGLGYPWVRCRAVRYLVGNIELASQGGLDNFVAANAADVSAIADQIASTFDVDIGIGI